MQSAVSDPKLRAGSGGQLAESSDPSGVASRSAAPPAFTHKRGRERLSLSWKFKLAVVGAISALVAVSLLLQA